MIENKILSLDLGSNSIGATIRNLAEENQFEKTTVITFETGVGKDKENKYTISLAANRTSKRSIRRLCQSRKYKLWAVLDALIQDKTKLYIGDAKELKLKANHNACGVVICFRFIRPLQLYKIVFIKIKLDRSSN